LEELADAREKTELELEDTKEKVIEEICHNTDSGDLLSRLFTQKKKEDRRVQRDREKELNRARHEERKKLREGEKKEKHAKKSHKKTRKTSEGGFSMAHVVGTIGKKAAKLAGMAEIAQELQEANAEPQNVTIPSTGITFFFLFLFLIQNFSIFFFLSDSYI
jgi:hypothetical protein